MSGRANPGSDPPIRPEPGHPKENSPRKCEETIEAVTAETVAIGGHQLRIRVLPRRRRAWPRFQIFELNVRPGCPERRQREPLAAGCRGSIWPTFSAAMNPLPSLLLLASWRLRCSFLLEPASGLRAPSRR